MSMSMENLIRIFSTIFLMMYVFYIVYLTQLMNKLCVCDKIDFTCVWPWFKYVSASKSNNPMDNNILIVIEGNSKWLSALISWQKLDCFFYFNCNVFLIYVFQKIWCDDIFMSLSICGFIFHLISCRWYLSICWWEECINRLIE